MKFRTQVVPGELVDVRHGSRRVGCSRVDDMTGDGKVSWLVDTVTGCRTLHLDTDGLTRMPWTHFISNRIPEALGYIPGGKRTWQRHQAPAVLPAGPAMLPASTPTPFGDEMTTELPVSRIIEDARRAASLRGVAL